MTHFFNVSAPKLHIFFYKPATMSCSRQDLPQWFTLCINSVIDVLRENGETPISSIFSLKFMFVIASVLYSGAVPNACTELTHSNLQSNQSNSHWLLRERLSSCSICLAASSSRLLWSRQQSWELMPCCQNDCHSSPFIRCRTLSTKLRLWSGSWIMNFKRS